MDSYQSDLKSLLENVGFIDAQMTGWYNREKSQLLDDFPIQASDHVLDVGCGDGLCIHFCANLGAEVSLVDLNAEKIHHLAEKLRHTPARAVHAHVGDANPLPFAASQFDKVISTEVLEHVDDPALFMSELVRVGKPGAKYLLSVPHQVSENIQKELAPSVYFESPNHIRLFSPDDFQSTVLNSGLVIDKTLNYGFYSSIFWAFFWTCNQDFGAELHPLLKSWETTWKMVLSMRDGPRIKQVLDQVIPKSQVILAHKPF